MTLGSPPARFSALRVAAAIALALLAWPAAAHAGKSHLLQNVESHVVLTSVVAAGVDACSSYWVDRVFARIGPDGQAAAEAFAVPAGHALVVTDVEWTVYESPNNYTAGTLLQFAISLGGGIHPAVFEDSLPIGADLASAGVAAGRASSTTGFVVRPGATICPYASALTSFGGSSHTPTSVTLRGYLIRSK